MNVRYIVVLIGGLATMWAFRRWRAAVQLALVLLIFEGAIRKWVALGAQELVYFAKDFLLLAAYAGFLADRRHLRGLAIPRMPVLYFTLAIAAVYGLLEILNPQLPNLAVGLLGFKAYFWYVPLLFVLPGVFTSDRTLSRFIVIYVLLSIPVGLLAITQFFSSPTSALNTYARATDDLSYAVTFGSSEFVRVTGTFSFINGYAGYLVATVMLALAVLATTHWRLKGNLLIYLALGMSLLGMLMTGSRGPVLIVAFMFPLYWWLAVVREKQGGKTSVRLIVGLLLLATFVGLIGQDAFEAFRGRASASAEDVGLRIALPFTDPFRVLPEAGPLGYGIGATHQAATAVTKGIPPFSWLNGHFIEVETGRVMLELGPLGFFLVYFSRVLMALIALRQAFRLRTLFHRSIAVAGFLLFLSTLPTGIVFDVTTSLLYWFFGGLVFTAIQLDRPQARVAQPVTAAHPGLRTGRLAQARP